CRWVRSRRPRIWADRPFEPARSGTETRVNAARARDLGPHARGRDDRRGLAGLQAAARKALILRTIPRSARSGRTVVAPCESMRRRPTLWAAGLLLLALALLATVSACGGSGSSSADAASGSTSPFRGPALITPKPAPDFALRDQNGELVRMSDQRGKVVLLTFLYTHCPDVCPLIAENLNQTLRTLGPARGKVRVIAVSVDPKGDTAKSVRHFVRTHDLLPQFHYLTGTPTQLAAVWKSYGIFVNPEHLDAVDHTAYTALVDASGK